MQLSAPIPLLKKRARALARADGIPLHQALDHIASQEGFPRWSLLVARLPSPAAVIQARLAPGDLLLIAARPGEGKTLLGLGLPAETLKAGHAAAVFTLEYGPREIVERLRSLGVDGGTFEDRLRLDTSDAICADHICTALATARPGTLMPVDYLQRLDQRRANPDPMIQIRQLRAFARTRGLIGVVLSQIDRRHDPDTRPLPDVDDLRLPNPLDPRLFDHHCFLNAGAMRFTPARG